MSAFLWIFIGGGLGAFARYCLAGWVINQHGLAFPYGTLVVNMLGCFLIGLIAGLPHGSLSLALPLRLLLITGLLGGFTTFSSYEYESFMLALQGEWSKALLNLILSLSLGFLLVGAGAWLMRLVFPFLKGGT